MTFFWGWGLFFLSWGNRYHRTLRSVYWVSFFSDFFFVFLSWGPRRRWSKALMEKATVTGEFLDSCFLFQPATRTLSRPPCDSAGATSVSAQIARFPCGEMTLQTIFSEVSDLLTLDWFFSEGTSESKNEFWVRWGHFKEFASLII